MIGADAIATELRTAGVEIAFGLPGAHNLALWPACAAAGVRIVGMRHEQGSAYAADGYARATGKVGVALVTTGPGAANTVAAVGEAWASRSPVVVIATDIPVALRRPGVYRGVLHETTDQAALFAPITKGRFTSVAAALAAATSAPVRPAYAGVPADVLTAPAASVEAEPPEASVRATAVPASSEPWPERHVAEGDKSGKLETAAVESGDPAPLLDALAASRRPLIWVGGGARDAGTQLDRFARRLAAPVVTTYQARGVLAPDEPEVTALIEQADLAVIVGSDLDQMNTMQWRLPLPERRVAINLDAADATKNYAMDAVVESDATVIGGIADKIERREPWAGDLAAAGAAIRDRLGAATETEDAIAFLEHTEAALPADALVYADMCVAGYWLAGHLRVETPRGLHYPMGWGTLGFALPAAVGGSVAARTVAFTGDGGALFGLGELSALAALETPCTIVVVDDDGYGMLRYGHGKTAANELPPVDFVQAAGAFGIPATRVEGVGTDYAKALAEAVNADQPRVVHVRARLHPPVSTSPFWPLKEPA